MSFNSIQIRVHLIFIRTHMICRERVFIYIKIRVLSPQRVSHQHINCYFGYSSSALKGALYPIVICVNLKQQ